MPTGIYKRSAKHRESIKRCLALGHQASARKKATRKLKANAANPKWRKMVSEVTLTAMHRPEIRVRHLEGLARALKAHGPNFKGGNGQTPVAIVQKYAPMFTSQGFVIECVIKTEGHATGLNCPRSYKVDFGNSSTRTAIEFDGPAHRPLARRALDLKKDTVLKALGWSIIRIKHD